MSCAVPAPPASCTAWAGGAGQKGPEMLSIWAAQVAWWPLPVGSVTALPSPVPRASMSKPAVDVHVGPVCA